MDNLSDTKKRKIENKIERLIEEYIEGNITKEQYQKLDDRYRLELSRIKLNNNAPDLSFLKEMDIKEIFIELPFHDKRKILEILINKIIIYRGSSAKPIDDKVKIEWNL